MAIDRQVQCIVKRHRPGPHERIKAIGGKAKVTLLADPTCWQESEETAMLQMQAGSHTYHTLEGGKRANVRIGKHTTEDKKVHYYLTTEADGFPPNNLLSLADCPIP